MKAKRLFKNSFNILTDYFVVMIMFGIFGYVFISLAKDDINKWLPYYTGFFLFIFIVMTYSDFRKMAVREKRPQYELFPKPITGFIYGLVGAIPLIIITIVGVYMAYGSKIDPDFQVLIVNAVKIVLGPLYLIYKIPNDDVLGFVLALAFIPLLTMAGYSAGLYNIEIMYNIKKRYKVLKDAIKEKFKIEK